jgi:hypothetical protein
MPFYDHIREDNIAYHTFIAVLNTHAAVTFFNDTVIEQHLPYRVHIFRSNFNCATPGGHSAIGYRYIFTAAKHPKSFVSLDNADHLLSRKEDGEWVASMIAAWSGRYIAG